MQPDPPQVPPPHCPDAALPPLSSRTTDISTQELAAEASSSREQKTLSPTFTTVTSQTNVIPITIKQSPNELALDQEGRRGGRLGARGALGCQAGCVDFGTSALQTLNIPMSTQARH